MGYKCFNTKCMITWCQLFSWFLTILHIQKYALLICIWKGSVQWLSHVQPTLYNPMDSTMPGFPVHHQHPELTQTHISSQWCHLTISSSVVPFSSHLQSFPASGSFQMSQLLTSGGQSTGISASASVRPMNIQDWFPLGWTGWISLRSKGLKSLPQYNSSKASILQHSAFFIVQLSHPYMTTEKTIALTRQTFVGKVMSLLFNMLSKLDTVFLPRSKFLLISWLQSPSAMILEPKKKKSLTLFPLFPHLFAMKWWDRMPRS